MLTNQSMTDAKLDALLEGHAKLKQRDESSILEDRMADAIDALRQERDTAIANLANLQIAFNDWKVFHSTTRLEVENEQLRALLREARPAVSYFAAIWSEAGRSQELLIRIDAALAGKAEP